MIALELDRQMIEALKDSAPRADVRQTDALAVSLSDIMRELPEPRGVVSNLPYYITGPLLAKIAEARSEMSVAVLMMQKEVAQRILAKPGNGDRGSLSVCLQFQFEISLVAQVPASAFMPPPKVDSTVLRLVPRPPVANEDGLFSLVRLAFAQPRKTLANNLVAGLRRSREEFASMFEAAGLSEKVRPHDLAEQDWLNLHAMLEK
jgi:16S rRNA (adenine1518-N6/adenine1519-N6)-dimethyltransferase